MYFITHQNILSMHKSRVKQKENLLEFLHQKTGIELERLTDNASLNKDLSIDSLDLMEILLETEKAFQIKIEDEDAEKLETIGDICSLVLNGVSVHQHH